MISEDVPAALRRLWRLAEPSRLGRRPTLDVDAVVAEAVRIADGEGLVAVTLPNVGKSLGVTGMSLYRYVGSKDELLTLMVDFALGDPPPITAGAWRTALREWAQAQRAVLQRHPWATQIPVSGPPAGPHQIAWMESALAILARTRLDWAHKVGVMSLIGGYVAHFVRQSSELAAGRAEGQAQAAAERAYGQALARLVDAERFPQAAQLFSSAVFGTPNAPDADLADADFLLGLDLILDGVAQRAA
ncbi:TetR/AcrR family transcriptional regulator C-terminal domain-containing protein [Hamadaea sp. NPDC050747]|uniref:TetR/AcrR family transcriptional regulator n=1 Tax=Hamadaea sp. NPDC050747 TaxID=3155789 RepID=UPI0033FF17C1